MASDHDSQNVIKSLVEGQVERLADNVVNYEVYPQNLGRSSTWFCLGSHNKTNLC